MKKLILLGTTAITIIGLAACSSESTTPKEGSSTTSHSSQRSEKSITLSIPKDVTVDDTGKATINGFTSPNSEVTITSDFSDQTTADDKGKFTLTYKLDESSKDEVIEITSIDNSNVITKKITIKQNPEFIKKKEADKKAQAKAKADAQAAEAQKEADKKNPETYPTLAYDEMARNGNKHKGEKLQISGKVIQVQDSDDGGAMLRVATSADGYDDIYLVQIDSNDWENHRLLEDDIITIYGDVYGLYSYESTFGGKITVPALVAVFY